jgi:adenosine 3'-phospho 5'-phosphosulfate transporter B2
MDSVGSETLGAGDSKWHRASWCLFYGSGIILSLVVYGLLQERLMTIPYGGELFTVSAFLVFCNRVLNVVYAWLMMVATREEFHNSAPMWKYAIVSLSNLVASLCHYESLKYVSFPVQMLGKSFKMMPVMLWGFAISGKRFNALDWCVAVCITVGVTEFCIMGPTSSPVDSHNSVHGLILLATGLASDGLTSVFQEKLFKDHKTSLYNQMVYVNGISAGICLGALLVIGKLFSSLAFCIEHTDFTANVAMFSISSSASQYFIYSQIKEFGALVLAATMNVRQIVSILVSYVHYHHDITISQVFGLMVVFGALFFKSFVALSVSKDKNKETMSLLPTPR